MSAPLSPRTKAILRAVEQYPAGADVASVVDDLDRNTPDSGWSRLTLADRRATVRRYLGRMVDEGRVIRVDEGVFIRTWDPRSSPEHNRASDERGSADQKAGHNPTTAPDNSPSAVHPQIPTQEGTPMTETISALPTSHTPEPDAHPLAALLDSCPAGPWPQTVHDRLTVVEALEQRRQELTARRDAALLAADVAEAAESEAIVDGDDTGTHAVEASTQHDTAAQLQRALATLETRRNAATLDVLSAQEYELLDRARRARTAVAEHWRQREELIEELVEHDGVQWRTAAGEHMNRSRTHSLRSEADRAARRVLAVRAVLDDLPLGFDGPGAQRVTSQALGTLVGADGIEPLLDVTTISLDDHGGDTTELVEVLEAELALTPIL